MNTSISNIVSLHDRCPFINGFSTLGRYNDMVLIDSCGEQVSSHRNVPNVKTGFTVLRGHIVPFTI